ncbi:GTPase [Psychrobacter sp. UBA6291]|uniref:GTPase n=1 Tax=Psychrobacter sp. UBA6291 TaxID=1947357 RepID=UPI0025797060|nr:GTPase [Psychrobacter sp. UBA6291]
MTLQPFDLLCRTILTITPEYTEQLARFRAITLAGDIPTVTVVGKYNHGKSRLLNELMGEDKFVVADKRETTTLNNYIRNQVRWLDAPGLDADVNYNDDQCAQLAVWQQSDIRLFVHSLREGELDAQEVVLLAALQADEHKTRRQTIVVFTQIDQLGNEEILHQITERLGKQGTLDNALYVSAQRYRQGIEKNKTLLVEKSGISQLKQRLTEALTKVADVRAFEKTSICQELKSHLKLLQHNTQQQIKELSQYITDQRYDFEQDLFKVLNKVQDDLRPIMQVVGKDASLEVDSFATKYQLTAGKKERNRIQVAYSRACIDINSHLIRYGVVGLPESQKTNVRSIDTVLVAVLGVSVKLRRELNLIFFQEAGRQRLKREFCNYFEVSQERMANKQQIEKLNANLAHIKAALIAVSDLENM